MRPLSSVLLSRSHGETLGERRAYRWALLLLAPVLYAIFVGVGYPLVEIENQVARLWIPQDSEYAADRCARSSGHAERPRATALEPAAPTVAPRAQPLRAPALSPAHAAGTAKTMVWASPLPTFW